MGIFASLIGGVAGYGTGALMPLVLVPIVGAEPVVPIIAISALFTNTSRAAAFSRVIDWRRALIIVACSLPTTMIGAWGYTMLTGRGAMLVIGSMLALSVPLRRLSRKRGLMLSEGGLAISSALWGFLVGGTSGAGIILLSLLMAVGLEGAAVIATDAAISVVIGVIKIGVFGVVGAVTAQGIAGAVLVGGGGVSRAVLAEGLGERVAVAVHTAILDAVVIGGGPTMEIVGPVLRDRVSHLTPAVAQAWG